MGTSHLAPDNSEFCVSLRDLVLPGFQTSVNVGDSLSKVEIGIGLACNSWWEKFGEKEVKFGRNWEKVGEIGKNSIIWKDNMLGIGRD